MSGALLTMDLDIVPVERSDGVTAVLLQLSDMTEKRHLEQQLIRSERLASLSQFASMFAHDIRNPLAGIKKTLELLGARPELQAQPIAQWFGDLQLTTDLLLGMRDETVQRARLGEIIVGTDFAGLDPVGVLVFGRQKDEGDGARDRITPETAAQFITVEAGHVHGVRNVNGGGTGDFLKAAADRMFQALGTVQVGCDEGDKAGNDADNQKGDEKLLLEAAGSGRIGHHAPDVTVIDDPVRTCPTSRGMCLRRGAWRRSCPWRWRKSRARRGRSRSRQGFSSGALS